MATEVNNWGRWGKTDELGALNLISPEAIVKAAHLVKKGKVYSLSIQIRDGKKFPRLAFRPENMHFVRVWERGGYGGGGGTAEDTLVLGCHGTSTHMDALCHMWSEGKMYNGFPAELIKGHGALKLGIQNVKGIVSRGVLLDVAALKGVDYLEGGYLITPDDLQACCDREGVRVESGDVALVRTGWPKTYYESSEKYNGSQPGLGGAAGLWLLERGIVAVGCDNSAVGAMGAPAGGDIHDIYLKQAGAYLIEMMDLEPIAQDKVYEFLFMLAPLLVTGGTGSSVNPLAVA